MGEKKWSLFWRRVGEEQLIEICGRFSGGKTLGKDTSRYKLTLIEGTACFKERTLQR
jgi:hypothetical protein